MPPKSSIDRAGIDRIGIVIPAKDEQELLPECLAALAGSVRKCSLPVQIVVVLDGCTDGSAAVVAEFAPAFERLSTMTTRLHNVGAARRAGIAQLAGSGGRLWIATTDADSTVPADWLPAQLAHAADGAAVVVGTVRVGDWTGRSEGVRQRAEAAYVAEHHHVHGANLSFTAAAYRRAGGFRPLPTGEDVALVRAFTGRRERIVWATDLPVLTSARTAGRAPDGFAGYLNSIKRDTA